jgi:hypothetical protein
MKIFLTIFLTSLVIIIFGLILNYMSYDGKSSTENNKIINKKNESKKE